MITENREPRTGKPVVHVMNGILTAPSADHAWTDDAAAWVKNELGWRAIKDEYFAGPILAKLLNPSRAIILARRLDRDRQHRLIVAGHSNGAEIIARAIRRPNCPPIERLVLIAGATNCDFDTNGLGAALGRNQARKIIVTRSHQDEALELAHRTGWCHNPLGLFGPANAEFWIRQRRVVVIEKPFGHSEWFSRLNFDDTMRLICGIGGAA